MVTTLCRCTRVELRQRLLHRVNTAKAYYLQYSEEAQLIASAFCHLKTVRASTFSHLKTVRASTFSHLKTVRASAFSHLKTVRASAFCHLKTVRASAFCHLKTVRASAFSHSCASLTLFRIKCHKTPYNYCFFLSCGRKVS